MSEGESEDFLGEEVEEGEAEGEDEAEVSVMSSQLAGRCI